MKYFIILALCLTAVVVAEELHERGVDFHTFHYTQHHQTVEEAKRKIADVYDGQHADFEEVGTYGGLGGAGIGTVGLSSSGLSGSEYGSSSGGNAEYSSSAASNFGASHAANFAASSSFGSNANFANGGYGSTGSHGSSSVVIPVAGGTGSSSYLESSAAENVQQVVPEMFVSGGASGHENYLRHEKLHTDNQVVTPLVYTSPSGGSEKYYHHEEHRVSNAAKPVVYTVPSTSGAENYVHHEEHRAQSQASVPVIQFAPSTGGSENYVRHEEHRVQNQAVPIIHYPAGSSEKYIHVKSEHVQQAPVQVVVSSPAGGQEYNLKYRKVTTTASQPQVFVHTVPSASSSYVHQSAVGSTGGSQLGHLVAGGHTGTNSNYKTGYYGNSAYTAPSTTFGSDALTSVNSNSLFKTGFGTSHQAASNFGATSAFGAGHHSRLGSNSAYTDSSSFGSDLAAQSKFGSSFGSESKFGSQFGAESSFGASSSASGLSNYMEEAKRLAEIQARGMSVGGTRTGGTQYGANAEANRIALSSGDSKLFTNLESGNTAGFGGFGGLAASGAGNSGYKTKSWEKASKWSSQSEFGPDGQVNNFKELSTGESENYDINGRRAGYKAATSTLDDNGKVSSYSLHT